jgi:hypothetical protein
VRRAAALAFLALALGGCVSATWWPLRPAALLLSRADRDAERLRYRDALVHYDEFLTRFPDDPLASRALESRDTVAAVLTTREELARLRTELAQREAELGRVRDDVARLRQELLVRQAESDRLRLDLERLKQIDLKLERRR